MTFVPNGDTINYNDGSATPATAQVVVAVNQDGSAIGGIVPLSGTALTRATVNITTATTTEIVALTAAQTVRVYKIMLNIAAAQTIDFRSNGVSLNGAAMSFGANGSLVLDFDGEPWIVGTVSQNFAITTSTTGAVTGIIYYRKEV